MQLSEGCTAPAARGFGAKAWAGAGMVSAIVSQSRTGDARLLVPSTSFGSQPCQVAGTLNSAAW